MFIFNKYIRSFNFRNQSKKFFTNYYNYNFNNKNNIIHSISFIISLNLYTYMYNSIVYKNSIKSFVMFDPFILFFISKKSLQKVSNY